MFQQLPRPTKTYHTAPYPAISPSRPELSLKGKIVLITAGATGIGLAITNAVAEAGASTIALMARREQPLLDAKAAIEAKFPSTKVETHVGSLTSTDDITRVLSSAGHIDILILSAGRSHNPSPTTAIPLAELKADFETNVFGTMDLINQFIAVPSEIERTIIHVSTAGAYLEGMGVTGYGASKLAASHMVRSIAAEVKGVRAFTFHPAVAFTELAEKAGFPAEDLFEYDDRNLPGHFAVWLCSPEADFLKGRFLWSHWDVEELMAKREKIEADPNALKIVLNVGGLTD